MGKTNKVTNLILLFTIITTFLIGCNNKLVLPIKHGVLQTGKILPSYSDVYWYIKPKKSIQVKACEKSIVQKIYKIEGMYTILANGRFQVSYSNLYSCTVNEGQILSKNEVIGQMENIKDSYLMISVKDSNNKYIIDRNIFK